MDAADPLVVRRVEQWFLSRGIPHFIDGYSVTRDVFTRTIPTLSLILLLELALALNAQWAWWVNVLVAGASFAALLGAWVLTNAARHRPLLARPDRVGPPELAVLVLVPAALPLLAGGQWLTALNTLAGNLVLLGLIWATASYGLLPMTRWAVRRPRSSCCKWRAFSPPSPGSTSPCTYSPTRPTVTSSSTTCWPRCGRPWPSGPSTWLRWRGRMPEPGA